MIVGARIMVLSAAVKQLDLIPGVVMIMLAAMLTKLSIDLLLKFSRASKSATYPSAQQTFSVRSTAQSFNSTLSSTTWECSSST
ncbi:hypothetical protein SLE2022_274420 [Rubroshorea leprosula]